jgi:hypothetical protein
MTTILATRSVEARTRGEALIRRADTLLCESWNERMWADGQPIDPSPAIDQAINGGYSWLEIECSRCKSRRTVDLAALPHPTTTFVHDLAGRLRCSSAARPTGGRPRRCFNSHSVPHKCWRLESGHSHRNAVAPVSRSRPCTHKTVGVTRRRLRPIISLAIELVR